jgi:phage/plasmid-like protein (TIGR03299 family)
MVYAGFVTERPPWWLQLAINEGHTPHTWDGPVPMESVKELLTSWQPEVSGLLDEAAIMSAIKFGLEGEDLTRAINSARLGTHKLIKASDDHSQLGVVGIDAATHTYGEWLVGTVEEVVRPDELEVSSCGLLKGRAEAWIQIERPESAVGPDGIKFSNYVTLSTSLGGTLPSQINQNDQMTICDNTLRITRQQGIAFRHTSRSQSKLGTYRGVMAAIMKGENDFRTVLERLLKEDVSERAFDRFMDSFVPVHDDDTPAKKARSNRKRQEITQLYREDPRVAAWHGKAFGVVQAVNTWDQHMSQLRNGTGIEMSDTDLRAMRNYAARLHVDDGETSDQRVVRMLAAQLDTPANQLLTV